MRSPSTFRQSDVKKAVRGVITAGVPVRGVEVDPNGKIRVLFGDPPAGDPSQPANEWDEVLE